MRITLPLAFLFAIVSVGLSAAEDIDIDTMRSAVRSNICNGVEASRTPLKDVCPKNCGSGLSYDRACGERFDKCYHNWVQDGIVIEQYNKLQRRCPHNGPRPSSSSNVNNSIERRLKRATTNASKSKNADEDFFTEAYKRQSSAVQDKRNADLERQRRQTIRQQTPPEPQEENTSICYNSEAECEYRGGSCSRDEGGSGSCWVQN